MQKLLSVLLCLFLALSPALASASQTVVNADGTSDCVALVGGTWYVSSGACNGSSNPSANGSVMTAPPNFAPSAVAGNLGTSLQPIKDVMVRLIGIAVVITGGFLVYVAIKLFSRDSASDKLRNSYDSRKARKDYDAWRDSEESYSSQTDKLNLGIPRQTYQ